MTKTIALITLFVLGVLTCASRTILGIEEYTPKGEARLKLYDMYGSQNVEDEGQRISVLNPSMGGMRFNVAVLHFDPLNGRMVFNGASFQKWFKTSDISEAKEFRDRLLKSLKNKYGDEVYVEYKNDQGFKCCEFGVIESGVGHIRGCVELFRGEGEDEVSRIYVILSYYAFDNKLLDNEL